MQDLKLSVTQSPTFRATQNSDLPRPGERHPAADPGEQTGPADGSEREAGGEHSLTQTTGERPPVGHRPHLRQDGPGTRHRPGDAAHDGHEEEDEEEKVEKQNQVVVIGYKITLKIP